MAITPPSTIGRFYFDGTAVSSQPSLGKITVRTVQIVDGWIGQFVVDGKPVWDSPAYPEDDDYEDPRARAEEVAREHVAIALAGLFA